MPQSLPTICGPRRGGLAFLYRPPTPYPLVAFIAIKQDGSCLNLSHHFRFVRSSVRKYCLLRSHIDSFESTRTRCSRLNTPNHRDSRRMGHPCAGARYLIIRSKPRSGKITVIQFYKSMNDEDVRSACGVHGATLRNRNIVSHNSCLVSNLHIPNKLDGLIVDAAAPFLQPLRGLLTIRLFKRLGRHN